MLEGIYIHNTKKLLDIIFVSIFCLLNTSSETEEFLNGGDTKTMSVIPALEECKV